MLRIRSKTGASRLEGRVFPLACLALVFVIMALKILPLSLWLDECGTYWVIKDGLSAAIDRATRYQGQSPFFYLTALVSLTAFGKSEFALRLPSLIAIALSVWILWLVARELIGEIGAPFAALVFLSRNDILRALSARPYALGLLCVLCSVLALMRWLNTGRLHWLLFYVVSSTAVWYAHFLFAPVGLLHLTIYFLTFRHERAKPIYFWGALGLIVLLGLPGLHQFADLLARKEGLVVAAPPHFVDLLKIFVPIDLLVFLLAGMLCGIAFIKGSKICFRNIFRKGSGGVLAVWLILPPGILFVWSIQTGSSLFLGRYFIWFLPALAIVSGSILSGLSSKSARLVAFLVVTILICVKDLSIPLVAEGWRAASAGINRELGAAPDRTVLLYSGFVEANKPSWLTNTEQSSYLTAPFSFYPVLTKVAPLPAEITSPANKFYFSQYVAPLLMASQEVSIVALERHLDSSGQISKVTSEGFKAVLTEMGFEDMGTDSFGQVVVSKLRRRS